MRMRLSHSTVAFWLPIILCAWGTAYCDESTSDAAKTPPVHKIPHHKHGLPKTPAVSVAIGNAQPNAIPAPAAAPAVPLSATTDDSGATSSSNVLAWGAVIVVAGGCLLWLQQRQRHQRFRRMETEAQHWLEEAKGGKVPAPDTGTMIIPRGEHALLAESSSLYELRADSSRLYVGTRIRIGKIPIYVGSSKNVSQKVLKATSSGMLSLTDKELLFVGPVRTARIKVADIVGLEPTIDTIKVNSGARAAPLVFSVRNPFIWFLAKKMVTSGDLKVAA